VTEKNLGLFAVVLLLLCFGVGILASSIEQETTSPEPGASADGLWHQTMSKGYYDGAKTTRTFETNDLIIREYGEYEDSQHFLQCSQRGFDFVAVRYGDNILWNYVTDYGMYLAVSNCYGECIVVNEMFMSVNSTTQTYISSSIYTKDGTVPSWLGNWDYEILDQKWILHDAAAVSSKEIVELNGKNLYMLENSGPIFKAEMEQEIGTTVCTKSMTGVILEYDESGYMLAMALDDSDNVWIMCFTGNTVNISCVAISDVAGIDGDVSVLRRYVEIYDASLPIMEKPVLTEGTKMEITDVKYFSSKGVEQKHPEGRVVVGLNYVSAFHSSGMFDIAGNPYDISIYGYTMPTLDESRYFAYCTFVGTFDGEEFWFARGFGYYDLKTGLLTVSLLIPVGYDSLIAEMTYKITPSN